MRAKIKSLPQMFPNPRKWSFVSAGFVDKNFSCNCSSVQSNLSPIWFVGRSKRNDY